MNPSRSRTTSFSKTTGFRIKTKTGWKKNNLRGRPLDPVVFSPLSLFFYFFFLCFIITRFSSARFFFPITRVRVLLGVPQNFVNASNNNGHTHTRTRTGERGRSHVNYYARNTSHLRYLRVLLLFYFWFLFLFILTKWHSRLLHVKRRCTAAVK